MCKRYGVFYPTRALHDGQPDAALDDARFDRIAGEARRVVDIELSHEMVPVLLDGLDADVICPSRPIHWAASSARCTPPLRPSGQATAHSYDSSTALNTRRRV